MSIHSDWGDWLPQAIADADPDGVAVWYLGCNGFVLKGCEGTTVFVDPYFGLGKPPRTVRMVPVPMDPTDVVEADAVLATHEHSDHVDGPSQAPILVGTDADYYGSAPSLDRVRSEEWVTEWGLAEDRFRTVDVGDALAVGEFTVDVEAAHDPMAEGEVSYVFEHEAGTLFHGGDTRYDDETLAPIGERYDLDLGVLAFGSVGVIRDKETWEPEHTEWYADENEVVDAANALELDRLVPSHWDMWKGLTADPTALYPHARSFEYPERVDVVEIGDRVDL